MMKQTEIAEDTAHMTCRVTKRPWLILPVETKARELRAKVLLACVAAARGWGIIVGGKLATRERQEFLPKGTFIEKSISVGRMPTIVKAHAAGNRVSALCEEGLCYLNREEYRKRRLETASFNAVDHFFTWGPQQGEDIRFLMNDRSDKVVVSGNPRFDLLRPEFRQVFFRDAERIRSRYGRILLINTKFSSVNNGMPGAHDRIAYLKSQGSIVDKEQEELHRRMICLQEKIFGYFQKMIVRMSAEFPDHTIVVRPHPSESDVPWLECAKGLPNVKVIYEGSANEWILAAEASIHNNCTTGIEAYLLGKATISYRPAKDEEAEFLLPRKVGLSADTEDELISCIREILDGRVDVDLDYQKQRDFARRHIANIDGSLACETIVNALDALDLPAEEFEFSPPRRAARQYSYFEKIKRSLFPPKQTQSYFSKKFPGINQEEMDVMVGEFQMASGMFSGIRVLEVSDNGFCIFKDS